MIKRVRTTEAHRHIDKSRRKEAIQIDRDGKEANRQTRRRKGTEGIKKADRQTDQDDEELN